VFSRNGIAWGSGAVHNTQALEDATRLMNPNRISPDAPHHIKTWEQPSVITGDLSAEIIRLKEQEGKPLLAHGAPDLHAASRQPD
jgi:hypothetical protein